MRYAWMALLSFSLLIIGCDSGGSGGAADVAGTEDTPAGVVEIEPGAAWGAVRASVDEDPVLRDLGSLGTRFEYPELGVAGMLTGTGDEATLVSVERAAVDGITAGDPRKAVASALGDPIEDLFIDGWWYPADGLMVEFEDDVVARVHTFAATR